MKVVSYHIIYGLSRDNYLENNQWLHHTHKLVYTPITLSTFIIRGRKCLKNSSNNYKNSALSLIGCYESGRWLQW
jgi:hypothetical protein